MFISSSEILVFGIFLSLLSPLLLVLIQLNSSISPIWYYCVGSASGLVNWIAVALSSLSDVMPPKWRAPSFGLLLAGFSLGFAMAPQLALLLGHLRVSILSFFVVLTGLIIVIVYFPETLSPESSAQAQLLRKEQTDGMSRSEKIVWLMLRPLWELSILNRNNLFRLLSALAFFSGIVSAGDRTLIIYYIEERLGFNDKDVALMFFIMGVLGVFVQGVLLKILNDAIGERLLVTLCFSMGVIHNLLYGLATIKATIFVAVALSSFVAMSFPTISAIKSNNVVSIVCGTPSLYFFRFVFHTIFFTGRIRTRKDPRSLVFALCACVCSRSHDTPFCLPLHQRWSFVWAWNHVYLCLVPLCHCCVLRLQPAGTYWCLLVQVE